MSYETSFEKLHYKGLVMPIGPIKDPVPEARPPKWDPNKNCKYHQGKGHDTEECWKLKEVIQDLIDNNETPEILSIEGDQASFDPSLLITPVGEPMIETAYMTSLDEVAIIEEDESFFLDNTRENSSSLKEDVRKLQDVISMLLNVVEGLANRVMAIEQNSRQEFNEELNAPKPQTKWTIEEYTPVTMTCNEAFDWLHDQALIPASRPSQRGAPEKRF